jgi:hypothetical protein
MSRSNRSGLYGNPISIQLILDLYSTRIHLIQSIKFTDANATIFTPGTREFGDHLFIETVFSQVVHYVVFRGSVSPFFITAYRNTHQEGGFQAIRVSSKPLISYCVIIMNIKYLESLANTNLGHKFLQLAAFLEGGFGERQTR